MPHDNPHHDVPVPPGAVEAGKWFGDGRKAHRMILGAERAITGCNVVVQAMAQQRADGSIYDAHVHIDPGGWGCHLSGAQARQLAAALLNAGDQIDGWQR
jgi:hypothetical protein